ncbi:MAG TPA: DUF2752 domain-containing protein [Acidobacteriota bacterium]|nr:DUF2752 domain-containing protein [Acidobacteriota bacterium]
MQWIVLPARPISYYTRAISILGVIALLIARFFPFDRIPVPLCSFRAFTGLPCPTCGMTTAFVLLTHGRWSEAVVMSPLGVVVFAVLVGLITQVAGQWLLRWPGFRLEMSRTERIVGGIVLIAAMTLNWVFKLGYDVFHWW